jgi:stage V sporulation protein R
MNEGWATFWHYTIMNQLYDEKLVDDAFMLEILQSHTSVVYQPPFNSPYFTGINPYTLGFSLYKDIRRYCENPTDEDKHWFPSLVNTPWQETLDFAMRNFKDESFIAQYLSPQLIRDLKLFSIMDDDLKSDLLISGIHDEAGYQKIRDVLSAQYNLGNQEPDIQIVEVDLTGSRALVLKHTQHKRRPLNKKITDEMLKHLFTLWQFPVRLESVDESGCVTETFLCPEEG